MKRLLLAVCLALLVCAALFWLRSSGPADLGTSGGAAFGAQTVGTARAFSGPMAITLDELGTVTPVATATVLPQASGYLTDLAFTEGQMVTKGQYLAEIDPRPYQIELAQYQAALEKDAATLAQARSDLARYEQLGRQNSISAQQIADQGFAVRQDEAATHSDQANIDSAQLDLSYCHITAPIAGRIGLRLQTVGNYVTPSSSTGIAVVTTLAPMSVIFSVAQTDLAAVLAEAQTGAPLPAAAYSSDETIRLAAGVLTAVDNQINTSTGEVNLRAMFANTDGALFPNEFVNIHLLVRTLQGVTLVPAQAVQAGISGAYVFVVTAANVVHVRNVTTGPTDGVNTVITQGLAPGEVVVTDGTDRLVDGASVLPSLAEPAAAASPVRYDQNGWQVSAGGHASPPPAP